ncbi:hypothetical protein Sjap_015209 [Stephania japonica]|uniref:Strictosidine synthase conserved region domain-containing protein n=1 Tax=Stephania japonica TaxID=461633 RepID=A0AAP0IIZ4_9MAGN
MKTSSVVEAYYAILMLHSLFLYFIIISSSHLSVTLADDEIKSVVVKNYTRLQLMSAVGPESLAFDCNGEGPYTGVSDGRIFKWDEANHAWVEFAIPSKSRRREWCDGSNRAETENICGRPLGLQFNKRTCDLYIADAYFGLLKVSGNGGVATQLASSVANVPFMLTNALDIDQDTGLVYFTDSSIFFRRWEIAMAVLFGDKSGRLMRYDPISQQVTVLLDGLRVANGVALSKNNSYILVAETGRTRIIRYWLQGPNAKTSEVFAKLPYFPDNIKRNARGEFWVALSNGQGRVQRSVEAFGDSSSEIDLRSRTSALLGVSTPSMKDAVAIRLGEDGEILEVLNGDDKMVQKPVSEVQENKGTLWIGSVVLPFVSSVDSV